MSESLQGRLTHHLVPCLNKASVATTEFKHLCPDDGLYNYINNKQYHQQ